MARVVPFKKQPAKDESGVVIETGTLGNTSYKIYKRGVIHIYDGKLTFKKNMDEFEKVLNAIDFDEIQDGDTHVIKGSGDNDNLVFTRKDGDFVISLEKRGFDTIQKLRGLLGKRGDVK